MKSMKKGLVWLFLTVFLFNIYYPFFASARYGGGHG
jgi:capsule polysaccharide export protein KpsE/RkpR